MATIYMLLYTLLISTIFADSNSNSNSNSNSASNGPILRRSDKFLKSKALQYAVPTNVCYSRNLNGNVKSMKLVCEDQICDDDEPECGRKMVAYKWRTDNCDDDDDAERAYSLDAFLPKDMAEYPYNCYEAEEMNGETVNDEHYTTPHMIIRLKRGTLVEADTSTLEGVEEAEVMTEETETDGWPSEDECIALPNNQFYRSFAAITDMCHLAWDPNTDEPFWYLAQCNLGNETSGAPGEFRLQKFTAYGCPNTSEVIGVSPGDPQNVSWPVYQRNGCRNKQWLNQYWYTEVIECTHPKYNLSGVGLYNYYYSVSFIIFMIIYMIIN